MPFTLTEFRDDLRIALSDPVAAGMVFKETELDSFRRKAVRHLFNAGVGYETNNYTGTHTTMPLAVTTTLDYAVPTDFKRITRIEYWSNESNTLYVATSGLWDTRARPGYIRIFDAPDYTNYRIQIYGTKAFTDVDDTNLTDEAYDAILAGSAYYAATSATAKRAMNRRSATAQDTALGAYVIWVRQLKMDFDQALKHAKPAKRPVGI